jgi:hypothetical protein
LLAMLAVHSRLTQDFIHEPLGQETSLPALKATGRSSR